MTNANAITKTLRERVAASSAACPKVEVTVHPSIRDRFWILELRCSFCAKVHNHGGGSVDAPPALGFRLSHCITRSPRDYELIPIKEETAT